ncbi:MAG: WD40 repeat domain-containing protein [Chloroflexota bacterium]
MTSSRLTPIAVETRAASTATPIAIQPSPSPSILSAFLIGIDGIRVAEPFTLTAYLQDYAGLWSPAYDEMVGFLKSSPEQAGIYLATSPGFDLHPVDLSQPGLDLFDPAFSWSTDGRHILFAAPGLLMDGSLWRVDRKGQNPRPLLPGEADRQWMRFAGWLDERSVAALSYSGGGHVGISIIDFLGGKIQAWVHAVHDPLVFTPNREYVPVAEEYGRFRLLVMARQPQSDPYDNLDSPYVRAIPREAVDVFLPDASTVFLDWLPGTNRMLVLAFTELTGDLVPETARLLSWNVDTDEILDLAPDGIDGQYSPDGRWLAVVALGEQLVEAGSLALPAPEPILPGRRPYLYLLDAASGQVALSLPVVSLPQSPEEVAPYPNYVSRLAFSPDGRYLAFLTPGVLQQDEQGWPTGLAQDSDSPFYLNILDLQTRQLVQSFPSAKQVPLWSPDNNRLLFRDPDPRWTLYDLRTGSRLPLLQAGDQQVARAEWSHSGRFLAFYIDVDEQRTHTAIIMLPE